MLHHDITQLGFFDILFLFSLLGYGVREVWNEKAHCIVLVQIAGFPLFIFLTEDPISRATMVCCGCTSCYEKPPREKHLPFRAGQPCAVRHVLAQIAKGYVSPSAITRVTKNTSITSQKIYFRPQMELLHAPKSLKRERDETPEGWKSIFSQEKSPLSFGIGARHGITDW